MVILPHYHSHAVASLTTKYQLPEPTQNIVSIYTGERIHDQTSIQHGHKIVLPNLTFLNQCTCVNNKGITYPSSKIHCTPQLLNVNLPFSYLIIIQNQFPGRHFSKCNFLAV